MELKQTKTVMDVRRGYLMGILWGCAAVILIAGIACNYLVRFGIPIFMVIIFGTFLIALSLFYDVFVNSTYRLFIIDDDIYIYYPTYSSRAGNEFIFYKVVEVTYAATKGSSIVFDGRVQVRSEGIEREGIAIVDDAKALFEDVFKDREPYTISKKFRISRIFEREDELMGILAAKKRK